MAWVKYALKRLLMLIPVIVCVTFFLFLILSYSSQNLAYQLLGEDATEAQIAAKEAEMGLDKPILVRYGEYMLGVVKMDFGKSWINGEDVLARFSNRLPNTLRLSALAMLFAISVGVPLGIGSAIKQYSLLDYGSMFVAMLLFSMPAFWLGTMCQILFCLTLHWLPTSGADSWMHFILPMLILGANTMATMIRMSRTSMLDVIRQDYIRTARAKGLREKTVTWGHAFRNSMISVVTVVGLQFGFLLGGSVVTEAVFAYPGLGQLLVESVNYRDYPAIQSLILIFSLQFIIINLIVDILYAVLNPEIKLS